MIVYAGIVPHSPVLIPTVGKDNLELITKTKQAVDEIKFHLSAIAPETVIIFGLDHEQKNSNKLAINQSQKFVTDFELFGDFETKEIISGDMGLAYQINQHFEAREPITLRHENKIDHSFSIPATIFNQDQRELAIVPISYSAKQDLAYHFRFGQELFDFLQPMNKRIAIITSGDLAHYHKSSSHQAKKFDRLIVDIIKRQKYDHLLNIEPKILQGIEECGLKSITMLAGMLSKFGHQSNVLSYESPLDIGYLVAEFIL